MRRRGLLLVGAGVLTTFGLVSLALMSGDVDAQGCMGDPSADRYMLYLHGLDSEKPSLQERWNRVVLRALAAREGLRIALPRARQVEEGQVAWSLEREAQAETVETLEAAARACFPPGARYGVLGFSRGGFLVQRLLRSGTLPEEVDWVVLVGAGGGWSAEDPAPAVPVALLVGRFDHPETIAATEAYAAWLRARSAQVTIRRYAGGHELPLRALSEVLRSFR